MHGQIISVGKEYIFGWRGGKEKEGEKGRLTATNNIANYC